VLRGKILKWGNSAGVRISRKELAAAGLRIGQETVLRVEGGAPPADLSDWPTFKDPSRTRDLSERHDQYYYDARLKELEGKKRAARR